MGPIFWGQVQQVYDLLGPGGMSSNETDDECGPTGIKMVRRVARVSPEKFHPCGTKLKITTMFGNDQSVEDIFLLSLISDFSHLSQIHTNIVQTFHSADFP